MKICPYCSKELIIFKPRVSDINYRCPTAISLPQKTSALRNRKRSHYTEILSILSEDSDMSYSKIKLIVMPYMVCSYISPYECLPKEKTKIYQFKEVYRSCDKNFSFVKILDFDYLLDLSNQDKILNKIQTCILFS